MVSYYYPPGSPGSFGGDDQDPPTRAVGPWGRTEARIEALTEQVQQLQYALLQLAGGASGGASGARSLTPAAPAAPGLAPLQVPGFGPVETFGGGPGQQTVHRQVQWVYVKDGRGGEFLAGSIEHRLTIEPTGERRVDTITTHGVSRDGTTLLGNETLYGCQVCGVAGFSAASLQTCERCGRRFCSTCTWKKGTCRSPGCP